MSAYDDLLDAATELAKSAYHLDRYVSLDYREQDFTPYAPDEVDNRLEGPVRGVLGEIRDRFEKEAEWERAESPGPEGNQRALTWAAAAELITRFAEDFEFTDSPELRKAHQWWSTQRIGPDFVAEWDGREIKSIRRVTVPDRVNDVTIPVSDPPLSPSLHRLERIRQFGHVVREARHARGMKRAELAERLQVTKAEIRYLEDGSSQQLDGIRLDNRHPALAWIAYHLHIGVDDLKVFRDDDVSR